MNKKVRSPSSGSARPVVPASPRRRGQDRRRNRGAAHGAGDAAVLAPAAERLLRALSAPGAHATIDVADGAFLRVSRARRGVSLGGARFGREAGEALVRHDLARWGGTARTSLHLTEAGAARARRLEAPDAGAAFLHQHVPTEEAVVETPSGPARVRVDTEESPLDWLRRRRGRDGAPLIDEAAYEAGERLRRDITAAGMLPGVTSRWEAPTGGPAAPGDATDRMVAARQRLRLAFDALGGAFSDLLVDLCGFLKGLELIERERGWPPRSGKVVVRLALARLAEHYGLESAAQGPAASRGIRAWQAVVIEGGKAAVE